MAPTVEAGRDSDRRNSTAGSVARPGGVESAWRSSGAPDLDPDAAVRWHPGQCVVEQHVQVGLTGRQLAALGVDADPGGRLQAAEQDAATLLTVGPGGMVTD
jgi:hypothetical protein